MNARDIASNAMITYSNTIVMAVLFLVRLSFKCDRKMNLRNNTMYQWVCKKLSIAYKCNYYNDVVIACHVFFFDDAIYVTTALVLVFASV